MFKIFVLIICISALFISNNFAQQLSDPVKEEKVKLSPDYYWEEASAKTLEESKNLARELLLKSILDDYRAKFNMTDLQSIKVEGIEYLIYMRGPKVRVIAYIEKSVTSQQIETRKKMHSVEVIHSDKYQISMNDTLIQSKDDNHQDKDENHLAKNDNHQDKVVSVTAPDEKKVDLQENILSKQDNTIVEDKTTSHVDKQLLSDAKSAKDLLKILNEYKSNGKLVFGKKEVFGNPDRCDIAVINPDTKEAVAYLIRKDNNYFNYKTNAIITDYSLTFRGMMTIWIQFIEE